MQTFTYSAYDLKGKKIKGAIEGDNERAARQRLRERKLSPIEIKPVREKRSLFKLKEKLNRNDTILITRQLSTLVGSGMPLADSLRLMADQAENVAIKRLVSGICSQVSEGKSLAQAFRASSYSFSADYIATISAGEETGHLEEVLSRLADDVEMHGKAHQTMMMAMTYPILMLVVALTIIIFLLIYVVPQLTSAFSYLGESLPPLTRGLIAVSDWVQAYGAPLAIVLLLLIAGLVLALRNPEYRMRWDRMLLKVPRLGYLIVLAGVSGWSRSLGMLLTNGVPIMEAMKIALERVHNQAMHQSLIEASERLREGDSLRSALIKAEHFPPFLVHMVSSGESSGTLDSMLIKVADYYEQRLKAVVDSTLKLFGPLLIIIMGGIVVLIAMAVLMPIMQINQVM